MKRLFRADTPMIVTYSEMRISATRAHVAGYKGWALGHPRAWGGIAEAMIWVGARAVTPTGRIGSIAATLHEQAYRRSRLGGEGGHYPRRAQRPVLRGERPRALQT